MTLDTRPAVTLTTHEHIGFELGWDYAHHRLLPPAPYAQEPSPLRHGLLAGQAAFGARTLPATRAVRKWLQLRLNAWLRGRSVELFQVTPHYLAQLDVSHCPITRVPLSQRWVDGDAALGSARPTLASADVATAPRAAATAHGANPNNGGNTDSVASGTTPSGAVPDASEASVDRVRNDAGYAAGNLVVMSARANHAKAAHGFRDAQRLARLAAGDDVGGAGGPPAALRAAAAAATVAAAASTAASVNGLNAAQWGRLATLCSFVEPLDHDEACGLPLLLLPPNRLRLFNPAQALQVFVSQQLLTPGWSRRSRHIEQLVPGKPARRAFQAFFHALLPRVLEAVGGGAVAADRQQARWAVEDAWRNPLVLSRWAAFARQLSAAECETLVLRAHARRLGNARIERLDEGAATEGWNLASRGYVPHAVLRQRSARPPAAARATLPTLLPAGAPWQARLPL